MYFIIYVSLFFSIHISFLFFSLIFFVLFNVSGVLGHFMFRMRLIANVNLHNVLYTRHVVRRQTTENSNTLNGVKCRRIGLKSPTNYEISFPHPMACCLYFSPTCASSSIAAMCTTKTYNNNKYGRQSG